MPGILGIVDPSLAQSAERRADASRTLRRMIAAMDYERWYDTELIECPALGVLVGRVGTPDSGSISSRFGGATVVTTEGPACPAPPSDREPEAAVSSTARQVGEAYHAQGEAGLRLVTGIASGMILDERHGSCLLFNDRYGTERVFLYTEGGRTYFSSEAKAILAVAPATRAFDPAGVAQWLACGCTLDDRSLFRHIEVLPAGTVVTFQADGRASRRQYFDRASLEAAEPLPEDRFVENLSESLCAAVRDAVQQPSGVAVSLTGGLDSRMIMACVDAAPGALPCYTFGSMYRTTSDVAVGRQVAARCGQSHQVLELGQPFLETAAEHVEQAVYISDGYMGLSGAAELYLNRLARSIAPNRLTGNWGGELLRGVRAFKYERPKGDFLSASLSRQLDASAATFANRGGAHPVSFALFHQMPIQGYGRYAVERSQVRIRSPFLANDVVAALYRAPESSRLSHAPSAAIISRRPQLLAIPTDAGHLGGGPTLLRLIRRAYRRSMAKAEYLTSHGAPNWIAAIGAHDPSGITERLFLGRDKFQHFRLWMRTELSDFMRATLFDDSRVDLHEWFDMNRVGAMVRDHVSGAGNYTDALDKVLTLAVAQRTLLTRFAGNAN